uniref:Uncharacterized protein n=1 Tax=Ralstonia solanacearum TaxID=305 RepID=A0A0S4WP49_RALSL|nr:protein of unknown function [Ralstonia solanacearum]
MMAGCLSRKFFRLAGRNIRLGVPPPTVFIVARSPHVRTSSGAMKEVEPFSKLGNTVCIPSKLRVVQLYLSA